MSEQLSLFDPQKYSTPSRDGKPDWFYDTHDGVEDEPSVSPKKGDSALEQSDRQGVEPAKPLPPMISLPDMQINTTEKITGGGNSTPGEEAIPGAIASRCTAGENLVSSGEGDRSICCDRTGAENLDSTGDGDRHITADRTGDKPNPNSLAMLGNIEEGGFCSIASDSNPLTVEEGKAIWDELIFGRKNVKPGRVAYKTAGFGGDRNPGRNDHRRVQSSDSTLDMVSPEAVDNPISSGSIDLMDQRKHNGKSGASGWISTQYKYRDSTGKSRTSSHWRPGCTGPYYSYHWREGDSVMTIYLPRKKLERVQVAIAYRHSVNSILDILG